MVSCLYKESHPRSDFYILDVLLDFFCMGPGIDKNLLDARIGKELESIFDEGGICQRK